MIPATSKVPADVRAEMVRRYVDEEQSCARIGRELFWSKGAVRNALAVEGVQIRARGETPLPQRFAPGEMDRVVEMYRDQGLSAEEIGRQLGMCGTMVWRRLDAAGVRRRTVKEQSHLTRAHEIAEGGHAALTARQRRVLDVVIAEPGLTTTQIGQRIGVLTRCARDPLDHLEGFGLVASRVTRDHHGKVREWRRTELAIEHVLWHALHGHPNATASLSAEPLRAWLERLIERERRARNVVSIAKGDAESDGIGVRSVIADRLGVPERQIYAILNERRTVSLDTADRMLTRAGDGTRLEHLWPDLAADELPVAA